MQSEKRLTFIGKNLAFWHCGQKWGKSLGGKVQSIYKPLPLSQLWNSSVQTVGGKREILSNLFIKIPHFGSGSLPPLQMSRKAVKHSDQLGALPWAATWDQLGCLALGSNCFPGRDRRPEVGNVISGVGSAQLKRPSDRSLFKRYCHSFGAQGC